MNPKKKIKTELSNYFELLAKETLSTIIQYTFSTTIYKNNIKITKFTDLQLLAMQSWNVRHNYGIIDDYTPKETYLIEYCDLFKIKH